MAIKKFKVTASAEANTKKVVKADKSINERTDDLNRLKQIISDYCEDEFGQKADFSDLKDVGMGYTTYGDYDEWSLEVTADLENCKLIYTTIYPDGTYAENVEQYKDWEEMANVLEDVTFDNLMSLQYFPDLCEDEYLNASCGKKSIKSSSAKAKRAVSASTIDRLDDIQFVMQKYVDGHGGITLVKDYNNGEFDVEYNGVTVHLKFILDDPTEFVYTMDTSDNVYAHSSYEYIIPDIWKYVDYSVLANDVEGACGKKSIKSATKAKKAVTAGTTPQDNVKPLSVGQARVFTYRGDPCVFVGVPNGMIFRWYPGSYEAKGELNYAKTVIKKYPNEWEEILREYGFDQYDANAEYQTLSVKNPVKSSTKRKPMKQTVKASASAKRRASKKYVKAYIEEYPNWVYDWSESKTERNKRKYDEKLNEWYDAAESMYPEFYSLRGADRKAAIEEVNKAVGFTMDDVFSSTSVKASIDSDYDTKVLRELEDYIKDNYPIYVDTEYAVYENENDWSVGLFATLGMVESDFEYYLNEQNPYLYNRLTETGLIGGPSVNNAVGANDFQFQLYPAQDQWRGPQLDIDETNLANAGDDGSVYAELKTQIDAFEIMYINALQELNYHMGDLLRKYDEGQGIHASTDVNADLQLDKYPDDRKKYSYSKNPITDIDGYVQDIADGVVEKFPDLEYEISDEAITFTRDGNVIYVQAIDEIVPERDDLNDDIDELASAIQMDDELNAMRKDFDAGWNATYDSDTATRAVEMSVDDDLEPIMGDDFEEEDMGFGFTTSGEAISESMVDELCRIANEILEKSELAKYDEYTSIDRDTFDYWSDGSTYVSEKFYIYFTFTQNGGWFINNDMVDFSDSRGISETEEFTFECDINIKDGKVVEVLYNDMPDNYSADMINVPALTEYIEKLATPVARDIYNGTTNI